MSFHDACRVLPRPAVILPALALLHVTSGDAMAAEPLTPSDLWRAWNFDPLIVVPLTLSAVLYARGAWRLRRAGAREFARGLRRVRVFAAAWLCLVLALVSPVDALGSVLFSGHMLQHEILMLLAAPLLVVSRPLVPVLWGLPAGWRRVASPLLRDPSLQRIWSWTTLPLVAWSLHAVALWGWHVPALFQASVTSQAVHAAQHASFFGTALLFWWAMLHGRRGAAGYGLACLAVFTTAVHSSILGALLTFAPSVWYPVYAPMTPVWGLTPLEDQQLGGLLMWVPGGLVFTGWGLVLFAAWLRAAGSGQPAGWPLTPRGHPSTGPDR
jgi:putative membrane protein